MTRLSTLGLVAVALLCAAPAAHAATARMTNGQTSEGRGYSVQTSIVNFNAAPGERNRLAISVSGRTATLVDPAGIEPGQGCARPDAADRTRVTCEFRAGPGDFTFETLYNFAAIDLGDGDDSVTVPVLGEEPEEVATGTQTVAVAEGGPGNDVLSSAATSTLDGGDGEDQLRATTERDLVLIGGDDDDQLAGGPGNDVFDQGRAADGADSITGGGGRDGVSYSARRRAVRGDLSGDADDGQRGERDRIGRDVENISGGAGADRLAGSRAANTVRGNGGGDILDGRAGEDTLSGGSGRDRIRARDGNLDSVRCGRGRDRAALDGVDLPKGCERTRRSSPARAVPDLDFANYVEGREISFFLACPRDAARRCAGRVRVVAGGREHGSRRFSLRRGRSMDETFSLRVRSTIDPLFRGRDSVRATVEIRTAASRGRTLVARWRVSIPRR